ncbi:MAG: hypothetical protein UU93_C0003G0003 [Candidatus Amesbacteria bacterium GW2011_GWA2_42_12]|uniref:Uncharacterized protein n=1 Tax=Candidatus Amesbacteria bacterium GW2011_GWA2_42_12 TaxID=1618356 RepID=A0A0G0Y8G3_9BACT|nr:MAG: hypothetical protein UU93_C0003G0003 [Candidatus Amesbacteria bacterium GW2011_GWA2_42_12]
MTDIRTSYGETSIPKDTFDRTADAITEDKHGPGWIKKVAILVGLAPRVVIAVETRMQQREEAIRRREGLETPVSPVSPGDSESTPPAKENKPGTSGTDEGHDGFVWDREK